MLILISEEEKKKNSFSDIFSNLLHCVYYTHWETVYKYSYLYKTFLRGLKSIYVWDQIWYKGLF